MRQEGVLALAYVAFPMRGGFHRGGRWSWCGYDVLRWPESEMTIRLVDGVACVFSYFARVFYVEGWRCSVLLCFNTCPSFRKKNCSVSFEMLQIQSSYTAATNFEWSQYQNKWEPWMYKHPWPQSKQTKKIATSFLHVLLCHSLQFLNISFCLFGRLHKWCPINFSISSLIGLVPKFALPKFWQP